MGTAALARPQGGQGARHFMGATFTGVPFAKLTQPVAVSLQRTSQRVGVATALAHHNHHIRVEGNRRYGLPAVDGKISMALHLARNTSTGMAGVHGEA